MDGRRLIPLPGLLSKQQRWSAGDLLVSPLSTYCILLAAAGGLPSARPALRRAAPRRARDRAPRVLVDVISAIGLRLWDRVD